MQEVQVQLARTTALVIESHATLYEHAVEYYSNMDTIVVATGNLNARTSIYISQPCWKGPSAIVHFISKAKGELHTCL